MISTSIPTSNPTLLYRVGLASAGGLVIYLAALFSGATSPANAAFFVPAQIFLGAVGFAMLLSAGMRRPPDYIRWLILAAYIMQVITQAALWVQWSRSADPNLVDSGSYTDLAAALIRHGHDPYEWDYGGVFDIRRSQQSNSTPLLNGASESPYPYPALPFLLVVPFQTLGLPGVFILSVLAHVAMLVLMFVAAPRKWQPIILLPALAGFNFAFFTAIGNLDILWALALLAMVAAWRRPALRAIFYGLALSLKQTPLLLAPFLLIRICYSDKYRRSLANVACFIMISAAVFLVFNGPFILWNATGWFKGYTLPAREALVIISHGGLSTLTQSGILYLPRTYFTLAALSAFTLLLFIYWRHHDQLSETFWIMPGIVMWFSFRALVSYWLYWALPMTLVTVQRQPSLEPINKRRSWKPTLAVTAAAITIFLALGAALGAPAPTIQVKLRLPMFSTGGMIDRLVVEVANPGHRPLAPRFAIQSRRTSTNPLPWHIEEGPVVLSPGQSGVYTITSDRADRTFYGPESVQLVVTDAGGDYSLRGVLSLDSDPAYLWPDAIANADYRMWDTESDVPFFWQNSPGSSVSLISHADRQALRLAPETASGEMSEARLSTAVLFPTAKLGIWLYPPGDAASTAYGLEIQDDLHTLWILFGPQAYNGTVSDGVQVIHRTVPAGVWIFQVVDLPEVYRQLGWAMPDLRRTLYRGLDIDAQVIQLRLLVASDRAPEIVGFFGPIIQSDDHPAPQTLMADTLNDPAGYYQRLGEAYERDRNIARALEAYQRALGFAPGNTEILASVERMRQFLSGEGQ